MFKIKNSVIVWDKNLLEQLKHLQDNEKIKTDFVNNANKILSISRPKVAYNANSKTGQHLRHLYEVKKPVKYKTKIDGTTVESWKITISPKGKYKVYYGVVTAGVRNKKPLKYTDSSAIPYPIHSTVKQYESKLKQDFIDGLKYGINKINRS